MILFGLALFVYFGDPAGGNENAPNSEWLIAFAVLGVISAALFVFGRGGDLSMKAAVYGTVSGIMFGLSSALTKPTLEFLHESVGTMLSHWECYALAIAGVGGFVLQQVSLGTGRLAPSVATVSVANPVVGILIGILLLDERLSRPTWHVVVAVIGLALALVGAVVISLAHEAAKAEPPRRRADVGPKAPSHRPDRAERSARRRGSLRVTKLAPDRGLRQVTSTRPQRRRSRRGGLDV